MKLVSFSIENYRSITKARKLPLNSMTLLIGPNNEGKSNILHALVTVLEVVGELDRMSVFKGRLRTSGAIGRQDTYNWERDFPVSIQLSKPDGESVFHLEFELEQLELNEFKAEVGSRLNGSLPIQLTLGKRDPGFKVAKQGRGGGALSKKVKEIAKFIGKRIAFQYIPAIRTADSAERIINEMIRRELRSVESSQEFQDAVKKMAMCYQPTLVDVGETVTNTLKEFLPNVQSAKLTLDDKALYGAISRSINIMIDDGSSTNLQRKGDGVQSLVALGLNRFSAQQSAGGRNMILAIEEPESHLHPKAIHQLKNVLYEISNRQQIILTTHSPVFVNRTDLKSNILVNQNQAKPAKTTNEIREILGVRAADNLRNAELILLVEGEDDRDCMQAILGDTSVSLRKALGNGVLAIDSLIGASNLSYKVSQLRDAICIVHAFLDNDGAGLTATTDATVNGLLTIADYQLATCPAMPESELEDLLDVEKYVGMISEKYGVSLSSAKFKHSRKKWSVRMKETFQHQGKPWSDKIEMHVKRDVADVILHNPQGSIHNSKRGAIDALVSAVEKKLTKI